jgi:hypothetical protein
MPDTTPSPKGDAEDLEPEFKDQTVDGAPVPQVQRIEHGQPRRQPDRERREDNMKGDSRSELDPRQQMQ